MVGTNAPLFSAAFNGVTNATDRLIMLNFWGDKEKVQQLFDFPSEEMTKQVGRFSNPQENADYWQKHCFHFLMKIETDAPSRYHSLMQHMFNFASAEGTSNKYFLLLNVIILKNNYNLFYNRIIKMEYPINSLCWIINHSFFCCKFWKWRFSIHDGEKNIWIHCQNVLRFCTPVCFPSLQKGTLNSS